MEGNFDPESVNTTPGGTAGLAKKEKATASFVSPLSTSRTLTLYKGNCRTLKPHVTSKDCALLSFVPPFVCTTLINLKGQRIVEVCIWVQSGVEFDDIHLSVSEDRRNLQYEVMMDKLMGNGWELHRDLVRNSDRLSKEEGSMNVRVHHWNTLIDEMRNNEGHLPWFLSQIVLPEEVCSTKILRKSGKESLVDLLLEDSKMPQASKLKRSYDMIDDTSDEESHREH